MLESSKKFFITVFFAAMAFAFIGSTFEAPAKGISITIYPGIRSQDCKGFGICGIEIIIDLRTASSNGADGTTGVSIAADAEVKGNFLRMELKEKPGKQFMNPKGEFVFPIYEDTKLSEKDAAALGCKSVTLKKGDYRLQGNELKVKIDAITIRQTVK